MIATCYYCFLHCNTTKEESNNNSYRRLLHCNNAKKESNGSLLSLPSSLQQKQKKEGDDSNYHCFLPCNRKNEEGNGCNKTKKRREGVYFQAPALAY